MGWAETAYTYGRAIDVVVPHPGEGVGSGNGTPVGRVDDGGGGDQMSTVPVSVIRLFKIMRK